MNVKTKVIMPIHNGYLEPHFGRAVQFILYEIENGKVMNKTEISSGYDVRHTGHHESETHQCSHSGSSGHHEAIAEFMKSNGADILVTCGIGPGAVSNIKSQGIKVITGIAPKKADEIIYDFVGGKLKQDSSLKVCRH